MGIEDPYFEPLWCLLSVLAAAGVLGVFGEIRDMRPMDRFPKAVLIATLTVALSLCVYTIEIVHSYTRDFSSRWPKSQPSADDFRSYPKCSWLFGEEGMLALNNGDWRKAIHDLSHAQALGPTSADMAFDLAQAFALKWKTHSLLHCNKSGSDLQTRVRFCFLHAAQRLDVGETRQADQELIKAINDVKSTSRGGKNEKKQGGDLSPELETRANTDLVDLLKRYRPMTSPYFDCKRQIALGRELIKLIPNNAESIFRDCEYYSDKAVSDYQNGNISSAVKNARKAIQIDPRFLPAYLTLGAIETSLKNYPAALKTYNSALSLRGMRDNHLIRLIRDTRDDLLSRQSSAHTSSKNSGEFYPP